MRTHFFEWVTVESVVQITSIMSKTFSQSNHHTRKRTVFPYQIVVISDHTPETVRTYTLPMLHTYCIPADKITIWLRYPGQEKQYKSELIPGTFARICTSSDSTESGFYTTIAQSYLPGTPILYIKDTVTGIQTQPNHMNTPTPLRSLIELLQLAFGECQRMNCTLWGIQPSSPSLHLRQTITSSLKMLGTELWGCINPAPFLSLKSNETIHYERCIEHYKRDGCILRLNMVKVTSCESSTQSYTRFAGSIQRLLERYPNYVQIRPDKDSKTFTVRLKDCSISSQSDQKTS